MGHFLGARIGQHHLAFLQDQAVIVIMKRFPVLRQDNGKRHHTAVRSGNAFQYPGNVLLLHSRLAIAHSSRVHQIPHIAGFGDLLDLAGFLYRP